MKDRIRSYILDFITQDRFVLKWRGDTCFWNCKGKYPWLIFLSEKEMGMQVYEPPPLCPPLSTSWECGSVSRRKKKMMEASKVKRAVIKWEYLMNWHLINIFNEKNIEWVNKHKISVTFSIKHIFLAHVLVGRPGQLWSPQLGLEPGHRLDPCLLQASQSGTCRLPRHILCCRSGNFLERVNKNSSLLPTFSCLKQIIWACPTSVRQGHVLLTEAGKRSEHAQQSSHRTYGHPVVSSSHLPPSAAAVNILIMSSVTHLWEFL